MKLNACLEIEKDDLQCTSKYRNSMDSQEPVHQPGTYLSNISENAMKQTVKL